MSIFGDLYRSHPVAQLWNAFRHRRISCRLLAFLAAVSLTVYTIYSSNISQLSFVLTEGSSSSPTPPEVWAERAAQVRNAFLHAYHGYERYAAPHDELKPVSNRASDEYVVYACPSAWLSIMVITSFNGWGVTMFDSLDTMLLMGLEDEFRRALPLVNRTDFSIADVRHFSF
jgi:hypothetical protein